MSDVTRKPDEVWKQELSPEVYNVTREKKTEIPGSGKWYAHFNDGMYTCACCGAALFASDAKYDSGSGWPSFDKPYVNENVIVVPDYSHGMSRLEVTCAACGAHLGHVFDDGPQETTGKRYCINSVALDFKKKQ